MVDAFTRGMRLMRTRDPQSREDGFAMVRDVAADHLDDLIAAYNAEQDHGLRCWLLELIGEARSPGALPVLTEALAGQDEPLRYWARRGLQLLDTPQARTLLWRERRNEPRR